MRPTCQRQVSAQAEYFHMHRVDANMSTTIDIRRANTRPHTKLGWLDSSHSFSFGPHYDPSNTRHGLLLVSNDDRVAAGTGFSTHPHQDMEIVTWVLAGRLEHKDSEGNTGELYPGLAQRMSAGTGIWHSEMNPSRTEEVHFVQMWVLPDAERVDPGYQQLDINAELDKGGLHAIASGQGHDAAISIRQRDAVLWGGRLKPREAVVVPEGRNAHLFVATGDVDLEGAGSLGEGDAVRLVGAGPSKLAAGAAGAEVLIWITA
jgi:quercetin 2,3-dioxygenase